MKNVFDSQIYKAPFLVAHRGYRTMCPENTLAAFEAALDNGFPMFELDVTFTKDRQLVVIHDDTLDRTTNGRGPVSGHTLKELKELDAGSWFHPDFSGERLPTLSEVFDLIGTRASVNVEIKSNAFEPHDPADAIERQVMDLIGGRDALDRVLISSFNERILERLREIDPLVALALISDMAAEESTVEFCKRIGAVSWHPNRLILTHPQVDAMQGAGIRVLPYHVLTTEDVGQALDMGVDGLIVDDIKIVPV